jgi:heparosan-N-sulfate-glucuronate 5-epimerase
VREERKDITLGLGDVSMSQNLGTYYIDMRPAMVHYTENLYGGSFDENGVPMNAGPNGRYYYPINIAQYGFMLHADWLETGAADTLASLESCLAALERLKTEDGQHCVWWHDFYEEKYGVEPPWASAMAQGELISLYLRLGQALERPALLESAYKAYRFMHVPFEEGGVRRRDKQGNLWLEEYPSQEPSFVLNGFIYALFGLYDLYRVGGYPDVKQDIDACLDTLVARLPDFDSGYWTNYDLQKRELVRYYYQKNVHVPQMAVLEALTGNPLFGHYRRRWQRQVAPLNYLLVQVMYRVRPRAARLRGVWRGG